jgi:hypothetical protein
VAEHRARERTSPRVTVLLPVYNGERHLREAIDSILGQTYGDFELLIVNDGSVDGTGDIIHSYHDSRLVVLDNPRNLGLAKSLNRGLRRARGELIARHDADDVSEPEWLRRVMALLDREPMVAVAATWFTEVTADGTVMPGCPPRDPTEMRWRLLFHCPIVHSGVVIRASVVEDLGGFDESLGYAEDYDLWCRIARTRIVTSLEEYLVTIRLSDFSMTATYGDVVADEPRRIAVAYMREIAGSGGVHPEQFDSQFHEDAFALLFKPRLARGDEDAIRIVGKLLRLHSAFCRAYGIPPARARADARKLRAKLGRHLIRLARAQLREHDASGCARFLVGAGASMLRGHSLVPEFAPREARFH